jgi:uncharacterized protein
METEKAIEYILIRLKNELKIFMTYHSFKHTEDVIKNVKRIAKAEKIIDKRELNLLVTAAAYHDSGFINTYMNHEEEGCRIADEILPQFNYSKEDIEVIKNLIMATKVPQTPKSKLEQIICDADLDYLGREDFFEIGETLYDEFLYMKIVRDTLSWNQLQVKFLSSHNFFTPSNQKLREQKKQKHLSIIQKLI